MQSSSFFHFQSHGFVRVAVAVPDVRVADPSYHAERVIAFIDQAANNDVSLIVFPELGLSSYSCDDLFHQQALLAACERALVTIVTATAERDIVSVVGMPILWENMLFNCAVVLYKGAILGVVPKTYLPNYREFYEARQFASGEVACSTEMSLAGQHEIPFGSRLLFQSETMKDFCFHAEICEDVWVPVPPSGFAALAGATILLNLSASNITIGKAG